MNDITFTDFERFDIAAKNLAFHISKQDRKDKAPIIRFVKEAESLISNLQLENLSLAVGISKLLSDNQLEVEILVAIIRAHGINLETELGRGKKVFDDARMAAQDNTIKVPEKLKPHIRWNMEQY